MSEPAYIANRKLVTSIKNNHKTIYLLSKEQFIDIYSNNIEDKEVALLRKGASYASTVLDINVLSKMAMDLGIKGRIYEKTYAGKNYIIFKGLPGLRSIFTGTRYLATHGKVVDMAIGKAAIKNSVRAGARLTVFLTVPIVVLEHLLKDRVLLSDLLADITISIVKVGIASIMAAVAATAVGTVTTVAVAPLAIAIFVGLAVGYTLDKLDEKYSITQKLGIILREIEDNTVGELGRGMWELEKTLRWQIMNGISPGKGIFYP